MITQPEVEDLIKSVIPQMTKAMTYHHQPKNPNFMAVKGFKPECGTLWIHLSRTGEFIDLCLSGVSMSKNLAIPFRQSFGQRTGHKGHNIPFWRTTDINNVIIAIAIYNRSL